MKTDRIRPVFADLSAIFDLSFAATPEDVSRCDAPPVRPRSALVACPTRSASCDKLPQVGSTGSKQPI